MYFKVQSLLLQWNVFVPHTILIQFEAHLCTKGLDIQFQGFDSMQPWGFSCCFKFLWVKKKKRGVGGIVYICPFVFDIMIFINVWSKCLLLHVQLLICLLCTCITSSESHQHRDVISRQASWVSIICSVYPYSCIILSGSSFLVSLLLPPTKKIKGEKMLYKLPVDVWFISCDFSAICR